MSAICIIDTSVFCEIVDVPSMVSNRRAVLGELKAKIEADEELLLPMTTILETGNHIGQNGNGHQRHEAARRFVEAVKNAVAGMTPWKPTPFPDQAAILEQLEGFPDWAKAGKGFGDQTIRDLWTHQCKLWPARRVYIWSLDTDLRAYDRLPLL